jgi:PAS domain S-box-containing protein
MDIPLRVLIIEDSDRDVALEVRALKAAGYRVTYAVAETAAEMKAALLKQAFDIVISDHGLPQFDAPGALAVLKQSGLDIPFIIVSGAIGEETAVALMKAGAHDYVMKDRLSRLASTVERALKDAESLSGRKQAEKELRESEEQFRTSLENAPDGIYMRDLEGNFLYGNRRYEEIIGYKREELIGKNFLELNILHEHSLARAAELIQVSREGRSTAAELVLIRKDGRLVPVEINTSVLQHKAQAVVLAFVRDITDRKRAADEMAALQDQFRQSQKMEAIGQLAGGIAHDFNNLLTIIKGYSQLSLMELKEGDPLKPNIEEVQKAADRAAGLTRQLLAFSRRQVMEMRVLDPNTLLRDLDKMLRRIIGEDIELVTLLADDLGTVKADPGQMEQVIMNLAVNARDAMQKGGKLTIETANVELDSAYARKHVAVKPGPYVMLSVSDTGVGMTPEVRDRVFEPFFTTKEKDKGTGLGLSTVYGIVKQSGGNIWVYSELGKGTAFKIYLPRVDEPLEEAGEVVVQKELNGRGETILVVEDEEKVRQLTVQILTKNGYTVLEASHGDEASHICEQHKGPIHLMVTDVVMPGMSGRELAKSLEPHHPEMKVLYMSGYTDNAIVHHGLLEKGLIFLQKPFPLEGLLRKVREVLDK